MRAVSTAIAAVLLVLLIAASGAAAYFASSRGSVSTTTIYSGGSGTYTTTVYKTVTASGGTSTQDLVAACKAEGGALTIYGDMDTSDWPTAQKVLQAEYPFFKPSYVGLAPIDIVTRGTSEYQASHVSADVFIDGWVELYRLEGVGALSPTSNYIETLENYSSTWLDPAGYIHPSAQFPIVIIYNTNLVKDTSTLPKNFLDLNNSIWKGKIAIDAPAYVDTSATLFASLYPTVFHNNNASFTAWLKSIAALNPIQTSSAGDAYTTVASGQAAISVDLLNDALGMFAPHPGAPVGIDMLNTTYVLPDGASLANGAPHSACGQLFLQFWASYSGQEALAFTGRIPELTPLANGFLAPFALPKTTYVPGGVGTTLYTNGAGWAKYFT